VVLGKEKKKKKREFKAHLSLPAEGGKEGEGAKSHRGGKNDSKGECMSREGEKKTGRRDHFSYSRRKKGLDYK